MPSSIQHIAVASAFALTVLARGIPISQTNSTSHGQTIFYATYPSEEQIEAFTNGIFDPSTVPVPTSYYECPPSAHDTFTPPSFTCRSSEPQTPSSIYLSSAGHPMPPCRSMGGGSVIYEQFQWATWTHSCWAIPVPAIPTEAGRQELSFQSRAVYLRRVVLYQHDTHLLTLNRRIQDMVIAKEAQQQNMNDERNRRIKAIDDWLARETAALPPWGQNAKDRKEEFRLHAEKKRDEVGLEADAAVSDIETRFWRDSWEVRAQTVALGHLVGQYFENYMKGWAEGDWNGMGQVGYPGDREYTLPAPPK